MLPIRHDYGWLHFCAALLIGMVAGYALMRLLESAF